MKNKWVFLLFSIYAYTINSAEQKLLKYDLQSNTSSVIEGNNNRLHNYLQNTFAGKYSLENMKQFVNEGISLQEDYHGTPFFESFFKALWKGNQKLQTQQERENYINILNYFLQNHADPNMPDKQGNRPLQWLDHVDIEDISFYTTIIKSLFAAGADPRLKDNDERNALFIRETQVSWIKKIPIKSEIICSYLERDYDYPCQKKVSNCFLAFFCVFNRYVKNNKPYLVPNELKKYIISYIPEVISNRTMMQQVLDCDSVDQWKSIIETCPVAWSQRVIEDWKTNDKKLKKVNLLIELLRERYIKKGKNLLAQEDNKGYIAKDSNENFTDFLDPDKFEKNFGTDVEILINKNDTAAIQKR